MSELIKEEQWVWVVIQDPGANEQFLGQEDEARDISFIPTFLEKEEAEKGLTLMARDEGRKYEVHAIQIEDLSERAAENGLMLFVVNGKGEVLQKIEPKKND